MESFKAFERASWERKAAMYDDSWGSVTSQSLPAVLEAALVRPGIAVLDCGCGPGHLCRLAHDRGAVVTGCDYSDEMIAIAKRNYPQLSFILQDAEALTFVDQSFDAVILNYVLLHVSDQISALIEARRVLKIGGRMVFTIWLAPSESPGLDLMFGPLKAYADMTVIPPAQDIFMFSAADRSADFLASQGFCDISAQRFESYWHVDSPEQFFAAVQAGTRMGGLIELQQPEIKEKIRTAIDENIERFRTDDGYRIPTPSLIVSATKAVQ